MHLSGLVIFTFVTVRRPILSRWRRASPVLICYVLTIVLGHGIVVINDALPAALVSNVQCVVLVEMVLVVCHVIIIWVVVDVKDPIVCRIIGVSLVFNARSRKMKGASINPWLSAVSMRRFAWCRAQSEAFQSGPEKLAGLVDLANDEERVATVNVSIELQLRAPAERVYLPSVLRLRSLPRCR